MFELVKVTFRRNRCRFQSDAVEIALFFLDLRSLNVEGFGAIEQNSLRATVEHNMKKHGRNFDELNEAHLPPVRIWLRV
jgi:hypothetical protein